MSLQAQGVYFTDNDIELCDQRQEIVDGLSQKPKRISSKYFYDEVGSKLFEDITGLPEYYPTRMEIQLLENYRDEIANAAAEDCVLVEYGSGASKKIQLLLDSIRPAAYVPLDISKTFLLDSAVALKKRFNWLNIHASCVDYQQPVDLPDTLPKGLRANQKTVAFFPGSSLGNFEPSGAMAFLKNVRKTVGAKGALLIGLDLVKPHRVLNAAYNDSQGVTAEFNLNILRHLNRLGKGSFNLEYFEHDAFFNGMDSRIEMHLVSKIDQVVTLFDRSFSFKRDERMITEYSYKFEVDRFASMAWQCGFRCQHVWSDAGSNYALIWLDSREDWVG